MVKTNLTPTDYDINDVVKIVNPKQYLLYIKNRVFPIDMYTSTCKETGNAILVMVFLRTDTTEVYRKWCNYELD